MTKRIGCGIYVLLILLSLPGCATQNGSTGPQFSAEQLKKLISGKVVDHDEDGEGHAFLTAEDGRFIRVDKVTGREKYGKWFVAEEVDKNKQRIGDVFCREYSHDKPGSVTCSAIRENNKWKDYYTAYVKDCKAVADNVVSCSKVEYQPLEYFIYDMDKKQLNIPDNAHLAHNNDGTVIDKKTGLQWSVCAVGQRSFAGYECFSYSKEYSSLADAKADVKEINAGKGLGGFKDWRIPSLDELQSLVYCRKEKISPKKSDPCPSFSPWATFDSIFGGGRSKYLTSTVESVYNLKVINVVDFENGSVGVYKIGLKGEIGDRYNKDTYRLRIVRSVK